MLKTTQSKVIAAVLAVGLFTSLLFGQTVIRAIAGSESEPSLTFLYNRNVGLYDGGGQVLGLAAESVIVEGATSDASEVTLAFTDPTADYTYTFPDQTADTYNLLATPDADIAVGFLSNPMYGYTADAIVPVDASIGDLEMYVQRFYLPFPLTVGAIYGINEAGAQTAGSNGDLGAAIYEDLDAGAIVFSCTFADAGGDGAIDCDGTDARLEPGWYRLGLCGEDVTDEMWGGALEVDALAATTWNTFGLTQLMIGESANDCTSTALVPATTGALEDSATEIAFWVIASDNS